MPNIDGARREDAVEESSWNDSFESNFRYGKRLAFRRSRADKGITWIGSDSACTYNFETTINRSGGGIYR